jgi:hypothetical protein
MRCSLTITDVTEYIARVRRVTRMPVIWADTGKVVGPLTIELAHKMPIFIGYMPIRISQLLPKLPRLLQILCKQQIYLSLEP